MWTELQYDALMAEFDNLKILMLEKRPEMGEALIKIHETIQTYPECVTQIPEDQIGILIAGISQQTGIELVKKAVSGKSRTAKSIKDRLSEL
jgi:hypothetical protein